MPRASVSRAAMISMAISLLPLVQTFSVPAPGLAARASPWGVARRSARYLDGICAWAMRSSSKKSSRRPGEREDHMKEPVNPRYEYVGGGFKEVEVSKDRGGNTSMYSAFDSALRAADYNMFCSPLKPVQAPTAFRSASRDVYLTESKAAELEAAMLEEEDPEQVARRTAAEYAEFSRLVAGSAVEKEGLKLMMKKKQPAVGRNGRAGGVARSQPGLAVSAEDKNVVAASDAGGAVQKMDSSLKAGGRGREVQGGLAGLSELADKLEGEGDREGELFSAESSSSKEKLSRDLEEGYDELQKLLGLQPRPGARTRVNNAVLKGNMTAHREAGMMKKVSINDPLRRVYAQRLKDLPADVGSPEAVARPTRLESEEKESEEGAAASFVADTLNILRSRPAAPPATPNSNAKLQSPRGTAAATGGGGGGGKDKDGRGGKQAQAVPKTGDAGRVVLNHSTHVDGLIAVLRKLVEVQGISTVVPGRLFKASGRQHKLTLRVTVPTDDGFKVVARLGQQTQEVFVVCDLDQKTLEAAIAWSL